MMDSLKGLGPGPEWTPPAAVAQPLLNVQLRGDIDGFPNGPPPRSGHSPG